MPAERQRVRLESYSDLDEWRVAARRLLADDVPPESVDWIAPDGGALFVDAQDSLAAQRPARPPSGDEAAPRTHVSRDFLALTTRVLAHSDPQRHALAYRLLWRIAHGETSLLQDITDPDVHRACDWVRSVRRDLHKMKAFVRFREIADDAGAATFIAWFEPDHYIVDLVAPFFVRRFTGMRWSILTPHRSAHWDGGTLALAGGATRADAPDADALESVWRTYYANIFNPARLKLDAMQREMPVRYWKNLPEAQLIPELIIDASRRVDAMIEAPASTPRKRIRAAAVVAIAPATDAAPATAGIAPLRAAARDCRACPLWQPATQTVFGEGPDDARTVVIGEQPGDQEDLAGKPFIGPAGKLFDRALAEAGVARADLYVTNTVKHFKFEPRGKLRLHKRANTSEQAACRIWLDAELLRIRPARIVCLGAMAAQAIFGSAFRLMAQRGAWLRLDDGTEAMATVHPSYLLRLPGVDERAQAYAQFVRDLGLMKA